MPDNMKAYQSEKLPSFSTHSLSLVHELVDIDLHYRTKNCCVPEKCLIQIILERPRMTFDQTLQTVLKFMTVGGFCGTCTGNVFVDFSFPILVVMEVYAVRG
mmetsp:Transcript_8015/g.11814  ORF Transcript_8015/g.11814 Transcript_8015/m.11814 type:complete len:102 (-) Transcript_8015:413-718(-)